MRHNNRPIILRARITALTPSLLNSFDSWSSTAATYYYKRKYESANDRTDDGANLRTRETVAAVLRRYGNGGTVRRECDVGGVSCGWENHCLGYDLRLLAGDHVGRGHCKTDSLKLAQADRWEKVKVFAKVQKKKRKTRGP